MIQVGIDISKAKFDAYLLSPIGKQRPGAEFENNLAGFLKFEKWFAGYQKDEMHFCMEGTGRLWEPLAEYLNENRYRVSVVNPLRVQGFAMSELKRSKSDAIDAGIIARFCKAHSPSEWAAPSPDVKSVRDIQRHIDALKTDRIRQENRLASGVLDEAVRGSIMRCLDFIDSEIEENEKLLKQKLSEMNGFTNSYNLLKTIIGIGHVTATTILAELGSVERFATSRELEQFCGIAPRIKKSGSSVRGRTCISKKGNSRIRKALYMASLSAMRFNPILREFAERLNEARKPKKVVICAVMRKLLRIVFALLKSGKPFDLEFRSTKQSSQIEALAS